MTTEEMLKHILDAIAYPVVFVDAEHVIRYVNKRARYHYCEERGYGELVGRSMFDFHSSPEAVARIKAATAKFSEHGDEVFLSVNARNERVYVTPVRDDNGEYIGYFERFEKNYQK